MEQRAAKRKSRRKVKQQNRSHMYFFCAKLMDIMPFSPKDGPSGVNNTGCDRLGVEKWCNSAFILTNVTKKRIKQKQTTYFPTTHLVIWSIQLGLQFSSC